MARQQREKQKHVEMIATRSFRLRMENVKPGDKITVPETHEEEGVPPMRWWQWHRKAAIDKAEAKEFTQELEAEGVLKAADAGGG